MTSAMRRAGDSLIRRVHGFDIRGTVTGFQESLTRIEEAQLRLAEDNARLFALVESLSQHELAIRRFERDDIAGLKQQLTAVRATPEYDAVFDDSEPLVSVRIAAYKKTDELIDRAIASVLRQSYQRFEIIVVNDGPNPATRSAISRLGDERIRYVEFPEQQTYPPDPHHRWMVAGSPGMNRGAELAQGSWIAPLDDDDEFSPDHLEKLVALALRDRAELAYGALLQKHLTRQEENLIWSSPPAISQFSFMGAIYLKALTFFRYDTGSWIVNEPGDWNLIRRMKEAGVRFATTQDVVGTMYSVSYASKAEG